MRGKKNEGGVPLGAVGNQPREPGKKLPDLEPVSELLGKMKFRRKLFGGVDEADVWRKLETLERTYENVLDRQAAYYQALIDEREMEAANCRKSLEMWKAEELHSWENQEEWDEGAAYPQRSAETREALAEEGGDDDG
ncbi:MAG: hypothetical protein LUH58_09595 [Lachnospiraceae bacterium]|nr:hypothetical protein [Lachnospiraceae bacterium]